MVHICEYIINDIEKTPKDVYSIKKLAFSFPERLPCKLQWFWMAKVLAVLARFILIRVIEIKEDFTAYDARKILKCFLSDDVMDKSVNMVKAMLAKDSFMMEEFMGLLHDVKSHVSITEQLRCKHQSSFLKKIFSSPSRGGRKAGVSGSVKRKNNDDLNYSAKRSNN